MDAKMKKSPIVDKCNFPMIWIDAVGAYIHWLPISKIQFEYFLCSTQDKHFGADWYREVTSLNSRISPHEISVNNYWKTFLTGIIPSEVQAFARWCGNEYSIPTLDEWFKAYSSLKKLPPCNLDVIEQLVESRDRTKTLLRNIDSSATKLSVNGNKSLADQMLLRNGIMEWVQCPKHSSQWGGMGQPNRNFHGGLFSPDFGQPNVPNDPEKLRIAFYGFRLLRREA